MKKSINIGIILFLLLQACSGSENFENQASVEPISEKTPINPPPGENNTDKQSSNKKANIEEVLQEFPDGALSFLSKKEQECIAEISSTDSLKDMEKNLMQEGAIFQQQMDYFTNCNIPSPPGIGIKEALNSDENNSEIVHYKIINGGHWWDYSSDKHLKTSSILWDFFSKHTKQ